MFQDNKDFKLLRSSCTIQEILDSMRNPNTGLSCISKTSPLPQSTFVSAEAVMWLMEHVEGVSTERRAIAIMEQMMDQNYIRHASGDPEVKFQYGFFLFAFVEKEQAPPSYQGDSVAFSNDWIEVREAFKKTPR